MTERRRPPPAGDRRLPCGVRADGATIDLTAGERIALCIMRCYFMSYARPQSVDWELGFSNAVKHFGEQRGPNVAWCCLRTVQAMRVSRRTKFHFCDPFCPCCNKRLTNNEAHLMRSLQAVGRGKMGEARLSALMLCEGNPDAPFLEAVERLDSELRTVDA
ncbi:hypothetical protein [Oceaniradius stylonematis]|uniref:hypothetical protein n=1 Tax=Oceaniradius stylonematis TaxID=2184161 RepID=UPI00273E448C|nr:hypothetical protein [Oceaniradius stylonematis]